MNLDTSSLLSGPFICPLGTEQWYCRGRLHRTDGPALVRPDGTEAWYKHGRLHRVSGPALEWSDGTDEYWEEGYRV